MSARLNPYRDELRPSPEASKERRRDYQAQQLEADFDRIQEDASKKFKAFKLEGKEQPETPEQKADLRDMADSQDLAAAMINRQKQPGKRDKEQPEKIGYSFNFEQPLSADPPIEPEQKTEPTPTHDLSGSQNMAAAMISRRRQTTLDPKTKVQEAQEQATEQTTPANDNQPQKYFDPIMGREMTKDDYDRFQDIRERARQRDQERRGRDRGGLEY